MVRSRVSLLTLLLVTVTVVAIALGGFGWNLVRKQRELDTQQANAQLANTADAMAASIRSRLAEVGDSLSNWLARSDSALPAISGGVVWATDGTTSRVQPAGSLPFVPIVQFEPVPAEIAEIESTEFRAELEAAARGYRRLVASSRSSVRAAALVRLGRVLRKQGNPREALSVYQKLESEGFTRVGDLPAELVGLDGQQTVFHEFDHAREEMITARLTDGLATGRWPLSRGTAQYYYDRAGLSMISAAWTLAEAMMSDSSLPSGVRILTSNVQPVLVISRSSGTHRITMASRADRFFASVARPDVGWALYEPGGRPILGVSAPVGDMLRLVGTSEAPWTLHAWSTLPSSTTYRRNDRYLSLLVAAVFVFLAATTYLMTRAIRREARVAQLQSEFVAAVSHEFRTPLTTIRQMSEMLESGRVEDGLRQQTYYSMISSEASRLQRLVETLLNFGRMEAGAARFRLSAIDIVPLVQSVASHVSTSVAVEVPPTGIPVMADESALAVAIRNLVENAVKYSPSGAPVRVECVADAGIATIRVIDAGPGIPYEEQRAIFRKFVRGRAALDANIKGTGVGLSMAQRIVQAHGGEIAVSSEVGRGSTFAINLPMRAA